MLRFPRLPLILVILCAWLTSVAPTSAEDSAKPGTLFTEARPAMGSVFTLHIYASDKQHASSFIEQAFDEIERVEEALSNYRPSSELSRINRLAADETVTTDPEVFAFLQSALSFSERSGGAFDITVAPLMRAWGFFGGQGKYPTAQELADARAAIGWRNVVLDEKARTVRFLRHGIELDPGGIGKGYAVDRVVALLRKDGVKAALVDAGSSSIYALGAPPDKPGWEVRVPETDVEGVRFSSVTLRDTSLSTSGSHGKFFKLNGRLYCHIMDPRTGEPVQGMLQTTVIAPSATDTDALSTAMFVLGPVEGKKLLRDFPGASGLWVLDDAGTPRVVHWHWHGSMKTEARSETSADVNNRSETERGLQP
jgi:thiamine biosynthesis lipoprotein